MQHLSLLLLSTQIISCSKGGKWAFIGMEEEGIEERRKELVWIASELDVRINGGWRGLSSEFSVELRNRSKENLEVTALDAWLTAEPVKNHPLTGTNNRGNIYFPETLSSNSVIMGEAVKFNVTALETKAFKIYFHTGGWKGRRATLEFVLAIDGSQQTLSSRLVAM